MATTKIKRFSDELEKFLKSKRVFSKAYSYAEKQEPVLAHVHLGLSSAFWYKDTEEGFEFWSNIGREFYEIKHGKKEA